jgi:hypothetical protein
MDPDRDEPGNEERHPGDSRDVPEARDDPDEGRRLSDRLRDGDHTDGFVGRGRLPAG